MPYDPLAEYEKMRAAENRVEVETAPRPPERSGVASRVWGAVTDAFWTVDAAVYGAANMITLNYMDEIGAQLDSWTFGGDFEENLNAHRQAAQQRWDEHPYAYATGAVAGALVPLGALTRVSTVRGMTASGAVIGAIDGSGRAEGGFDDRLTGALYGGGAGAIGGYVLGAAVIPAVSWGGRRIAAIWRHGRDPEVVPAATSRVEQAATNHADDAARPAAPAAEGAAARRPNTITGQADDVLEDGALLTMRELLGDPGAARAALNRRLGKLTEEQAVQLAARLDKAELEGTVINDPHYRSLLGIDLRDPDVTPAAALRAAELLEEATEAIRKKAGGAARTQRSMDREFRERLEAGVTMGDLSEIVKHTSDNAVNARIANHVAMLAAVQFQRAKDLLLPAVRKGIEGAREELAEVLTKAAQAGAYANAIKSNLGRGLQQLQVKGVMGVEHVADDLLEIESLATIRKRVDGALDALGDDDLVTLLGKLRKLSDVERLEEVLLDPARAAEFSAWRRTMNSVSLWLRSNALTPATGLFNTISFVAHDFFRNDLVKRWAARGFERAGKADDALALRFESSVARGVYWEAQRRGFKALLKRVDWEGWTAVEKIASAARGASSSLAVKARAMKGTMLDRGFRAPENREVREVPTLSLANPAEFDARLAARVNGGGALATLVNAASRAKTAAVTTVDQLGSAGMKLFTGAIDDWGREFTKLKETYALTARYAIREALEQGLPEREAIQYAERRAKELAEFPPSDLLQKVEAALVKGEEPDGDLRFLMGLQDDIDTEAERILFNDGPQTAFGRTSAKFATGIDRVAGLGQVEGVLLPYIRTPIRLFERGLVSYTPWGAASKEVQVALAKGGLEAELVKAQMEVGSMGIGMGFLLGLSGTITLTNGGWQNSANLDAGPPNRLNLPGGGYVELGRLDPFSLTLALGGFVGQAMRAGVDRGREFEASEGIKAAVQIAFLAIRDSALEKSYLTGVRDLMEVIFARDEDGAAANAEQLLQKALSRLVPLAGTSRQITDTIRGNAPEAVGWVDNMLRAIPGGSLFLPDRMDPLGDPVDGRVVGVAAGSRNTDWVKARLRELEIDITSLRAADPRGFGLTSRELSELRRIRGHEALDTEGRTMRVALEELFADPEFQALALAEKQDRVVNLMRSFNEDARAIMEERDPGYRSNREAYRSLLDYMAEGLTRDEAEREARREMSEAGNPDPDRL